MTCLSCGAEAGADPSTGYDADAICPRCAREGWELTKDGQLLGPGDQLSELSEVSEPPRAEIVARVPRRMVRAHLRPRRVRGVSRSRSH